MQITSSFLLCICLTTV